MDDEDRGEGTSPFGEKGGIYFHKIKPNIQKNRQTHAIPTPPNIWDTEPHCLLGQTTQQ